MENNRYLQDKIAYLMEKALLKNDYNLKLNQLVIMFRFINSLKY